MEHYKFIVYSFSETKYKYNVSIDFKASQSQCLAMGFTNLRVREKTWGETIRTFADRTKFVKRFPIEK